MARTLEHTDPVTLWLVAATDAIQPFALLATPVSLHAGEDDRVGIDLYVAMHRLAHQFDAMQMAHAEQALRAHDACSRAAQEPGADTLAPAVDAACNLYTPQLDAAYFLGLAMGMRVASALFGQKGGA